MLISVVLLRGEGGSTKPAGSDWESDMWPNRAEEYCQAGCDVQALHVAPLGPNQVCECLQLEFFLRKNVSVNFI